MVWWVPTGDGQDGWLSLAHCVSSLEVQVLLSDTPWALAGHGVEITVIAHHVLDVFNACGRVVLRWEGSRMYDIDMDSYG